MKKGFTLIELLAVILILGIIALIAIPTVNNIINEAEESAARRNAEQYINAVEQAVTIQDMKGNTIIGAKSVEDLKDLVKLKGTLPSTGNIVIEDNEVIACNLKIGDYAVVCNEGELVLNKSVKGNIAPQLVVDNNHNGQADMNDKICIDTECFYVISRNSSKIRMLAEWNLNVGYDMLYEGKDTIEFDAPLEKPAFDSTLKALVIPNATYAKLNPSVVKQDSTRRGLVENRDRMNVQVKGVIAFAPATSYDDTPYWTDSNRVLLSKYGSSYPAYIYDSGSNLYPYINSYVENLKSMTGNQNITGNLITKDELVTLGCNVNSYNCAQSYTCTEGDLLYGYSLIDANNNNQTCTEVGQKIMLGGTAENYVYQTSYWTGTVDNGFQDMWTIESQGIFFSHVIRFSDGFNYGVRPVIEIPVF